MIIVLMVKVYCSKCKEEYMWSYKKDDEYICDNCKEEINEIGILQSKEGELVRQDD